MGQGDPSSQHQGGVVRPLAVAWISFRRRLDGRANHVLYCGTELAIRGSKALARSNGAAKEAIICRPRQRINRRLLFHGCGSDCRGAARPKLQGLDQQRREVLFRGSVVGGPRRDFTPASKPASTKRRLDGLLADRNQRSAHTLRSLHRRPAPWRSPAEEGCSLRRLRPGSV
jgi:hypothetical protein